MTTAELVELVRNRHVFRGRAVFELADRAKAGDVDAAVGLGELSRLPFVREDRVFHQVSLAWAAITGLLAAEQPEARSVAYQAFADLPEDEQRDMLAYLGCERIEDAHPQV